MKTLRLVLTGLSVLSVAAASVAGCSARPNEEETGEVTKKVVGPEGGTISARGLVLVIPRGALSSAHELSVRVNDSAPGVTGARSAVYQFGPSGLTFATPVLVEIDAPGLDSGFVYWTRPNDESSFEPAGVVTLGKGRALATHFSSAYAGASSCAAPPPADDGGVDAGGACICRATDGQADALCAIDPNGTDSKYLCPDHSFKGSTGGGCSGYGHRSADKFLCSCRASNGDFLCPKPFVLNPQNCPVPSGLNGFDGMNGQGCSGYTIISHPDTNEPYNQGMSGVMEGCQADGTHDKFISVSGTLECPNGSSDAGTGGDDAGAADAGPEPPPGEDPIMTDPPGDCADADGGASAQYTALIGKVTDECKTKPRSCKGLAASMDAAEVEKRWQQNFTCYTTRLEVMQTCFRGGDNRHHEALRQVQNAMTNCQESACR